MENKFKELRVLKVPIISLLIVLLMCFFVLYTPKPVTSNNQDKFSAVRAAKHIEAISKKPHSYYDQEELKEVREYIYNTLEDYLPGNVSTTTYNKEDVKSLTNKEDVPYDVTNVLGVLEGTNKEGIMLVSHYDSRGHVGRSGELGRSYGAMDDGYGVSTMLELAYLLKDLNPTNSVYFLFTDAEEVGLFGATMAAKDDSLMENIRFVINLESRGRFGPAYMFETSNNNSKVFELYKKAKLPITYSMATAVYSVMPNYTDFTPFKNENFPGINFAILAGLENYHTPMDNYENINLSSIQHMGVQTEPVVREFISNDKYIQDNYFTAKNDTVFFTLFAGVLVSYSQVFAIVLAILILIGFVLMLVLNIKNNNIDKNSIHKTLGKGTLLTLVLLVGTYIFSNVAAFIGKTDFSLTYTRMNNADILSFIFITFVTFVLVKNINKNKNNNTLIIGVAINTLLTLVTTFFLPGASYLFAVTALIGLIVLGLEYVNNSLVKKILYVIGFAVLLFMILPLLWSFYNALTIGGMTILVLLLILNFIVCIPIIIKNFNLYKN